MVTANRNEEVMVDAYNEKDRHHHHLTSPWADDDESED
jgi:hypothetical protein